MVLSKVKGSSYKFDVIGTACLGKSQLWLCETISLFSDLMHHIFGSITDRISHMRVWENG